MQQQAYDFSLFEQRRAPAPAPAPAAPLRAVAGGKPRVSRLKSAAVSLWNLLACTVFLALAILLIQSKVTLTELNTNVQRTRDQLTTAQSTNNYLNGQLSSRTNMENIEDIASRLGLMKVDESQITYIRLEDSGVLTTTESPVKKWTDVFHSGLLSLMETLDP
jgi:cell division protein FtsL